LANRGLRLFREALAAYLASITYVDACVGRVFDALQSSRYARHTLVVLVGDHGLHYGEKDLVAYKHTLWEPSVRIPLMIVVPGSDRRSLPIHKPVSCIDVFPTLTELAGFATPPHLDGRSLVELINTPSAGRPPVIISTATFPRGSPFSKHWFCHYAVVDGEFKLIQYNNGRGAPGERELYKLDSDPNEWNSLARDPAYRPIMENLISQIPKEVPWEVVPKGL
jgi:arylsulfatase A-like enzyme